MKIYVSLSMLFCVVLASVSFSANNIIFPGRSGVYNITKPPYNFVPNGTNDATIALRQILKDAHDHRKTVGWVNAVVYLPKGKYLVSDTISWPYSTPSEPFAIGPHLIGQSRDSTIIILKDNTTRFADSTKPRWLISTGDGVAQFFNRGIQNLTINTGKGNHGVIALNYFGNNQSIASDLNIISPDRSGHAGMDLSRSEEGPALARKIYIRGYKYGIWSNALNSVTLAQIRIVGSRWFGIYNQRNPLYIDSLFTDSCGREKGGTQLYTSGCAIENANGGAMVLVNAFMFNGASNSVAIRNSGSFFMKNIHTTGYARALFYALTPSIPPRPSPPMTADIAEYVTGRDTALFTPASKVSMNLPVQYPPEVDWELDTTKWAFPTDSGSLRTAINNLSITHICIPKGANITLNNNVTVGGNIRRIIMVASKMNGSGTLIIGDGNKQTIKLEKMTSNFADLNISIQTSRKVIIEASTVGPYIKCEGTKAGEFYYLDIPVPVLCTNPNQKIWAWNYNAEGGGSSYMLDMSGGTARIFGWKDEGNGISARMTGGTAELLGFYNYSSDENKGTTPQFTLSGTAQFCAVMATQHNWSNADAIPNGWYHTLVQESRNNVTRTLTRENNHNDYSLPLYCAFTPVAVQNSVANVSHKAQIPRAQIQANTIRVPFVLASAGLVSVVVTALDGSVVHASQEQRIAGSYAEQYSLAHVPARGVYAVSISLNGQLVSRSKFLLN